MGEPVEGILEKLEDRNGNPIISYDLAQQKKNWENILQKCSEGSVVSGRVKTKVKGGLIVSIGVDAFLPASHIDIQPPKNLDQYIGQTYDFKVLKINQDRKNIVLSRRGLRLGAYLLSHTCERASGGLGSEPDEPCSYPQPIRCPGGEYRHSGAPLQPFRLSPVPQ